MATVTYKQIIERPIETAPVEPPIDESIIPTACENSILERSWRVNKPSTIIMNLGYWNLAEIGSELAYGFNQYTNYGYWNIAVGRSWINERMWFETLTENDNAMVRDLMKCCSHVHVNEYHNLPWLESINHIPKKMLIHHHGVEYRDNPTKYEIQETEAGYARIVSTPDLLSYGSPEYRKNLVWLPSPINLKELDNCYPKWEPRDKKDTIRVGHSYTIKTNKGTDEFIKIMEDLKSSGNNCSTELIHKIQRRPSIYYESQFDIFFASMKYGYGLSSMECMAFGIPVIVGCNYDEIAAIREAIGVKKNEDLPFVYVSDEIDLKVKLRNLVNDVDLRNEYGKRGRKFIEKVHSVPVVVKKLKNIYDKIEPCNFMVETY